MKRWRCNVVYIIQFDKKLAGRAGYYVGWTRNESTLQHRIDHHRQGTGAKITAAASQCGIKMNVVAIIPDGDRTIERMIKNQKNHRRIIEQIAKSGRIYGLAAQIVNGGI